MAAANSHPTRTWPPALAAYNYVLTLNDEEVAWEALRCNPDYQRHYQLTSPHHIKPRGWMKDRMWRALTKSETLCGGGRPWAPSRVL